MEDCFLKIYLKEVSEIYPLRYIKDYKDIEMRTGYKFIITNEFGFDYIEKVIINEEILEVDEYLGISICCKLENIDSYYDFPKEVSFVMYNNENDFIIDIIECIFLKKIDDKFMIKILMGKNFSDWKKYKWNLNYFFSVYKPILKERTKDIDIEIEEIKDEEEMCILDIKFYYDELISANKQINDCIRILKDIYDETDRLIFNDSEDKYHHYKIHVHEQIHTAVKQYLIYFSDFVKSTKGEKIDLEVISEEENLDIRIVKTKNFQNINTYLEEYCGFIKQNIDNINPKFEIDIVETKKDLLIVELRNQIRNLHSSLETKLAEQKFLNKTVDILETLLLEEKRNPQPITVNVESYLAATANSTSEMNIDLQTYLPNLQSDFFDFKEILISYNENIKNEVSKIDDDLMSMSNDPKEIEKNKSVFRRIKRLLDKVNDKESDLNKTINTAKNGISSLQKLAKTYNKFATWLGLITIPELFLVEK